MTLIFCIVTFYLFLNRKEINDEQRPRFYVSECIMFVKCIKSIFYLILFIYSFCVCSSSSRRRIKCMQILDCFLRFESVEFNMLGDV